jgi:hypothetical protein
LRQERRSVMKKRRRNRSIESNAIQTIPATLASWRFFIYPILFQPLLHRVLVSLKWSRNQSDLETGGVSAVKGHPRRPTIFPSPPPPIHLIPSQIAVRVCIGDVRLNGHGKYIVSIFHSLAQLIPSPSLTNISQYLL